MTVKKIFRIFIFYHLYFFKQSFKMIDFHQKDTNLQNSRKRKFSETKEKKGELLQTDLLQFYGIIKHFASKPDCQTIKQPKKLFRELEEVTVNNKETVTINKPKKRQYDSIFSKIHLYESIFTNKK